MSRPKRKRKIDKPPLMKGYKPFGIPLRHVNCISLLFEEYEAIRLADYELLTQEQASERMQVSRPTFTRIYEQARQKMAKAFVEGQAILIEGGDIEVNENWFRCNKCFRLFTSKDSHICTNCGSDDVENVSESIMLGLGKGRMKLLCLKCDKKTDGIPDYTCATCCTDITTDD